MDLIDRIFRNPVTGVRREVVGLRELSQLLDVCYRTVQRAVQGGRLHAVPVGRQWKVGRDALAEFLDINGRTRLSKFPKSIPAEDQGGSFPEAGGFDPNGNEIPF